jgi:uncharacterized protein HemY
VLLVIVVVLMWIVTRLLFRFLRAVLKRAAAFFSSAKSVEAPRESN